MATFSKHRETLARAYHHPIRRRKKKKKRGSGHAFRLGWGETSQSERTANQSNQSNQIRSRLHTKVFSAKSVTCIDDKDVSGPASIRSRLVFSFFLLSLSWHIYTLIRRFHSLCAYVYIDFTLLLPAICDASLTPLVWNYCSIKPKQPSKS